MSAPTTRQAYLSACKKKLRSSMRSTLKSMPQSDIRDQTKLVTSYVTSHPAFQKAQVISCYLSMPSGEIDTSFVVSHILQSGKTLFVPRIDRERDEIDMLEIYDEHDLDDLPSGTWGIKEPDIYKDGHCRKNALDPESPLLDLILLPGLAFDRTLSRLGHGKGYYDRFLSAYQAMLSRRSADEGRIVPSMPTLLALALKPQVLDSDDRVPVGDHDWKMDGIIFPEGLIGGSPSPIPLPTQDSAKEKT